MDRDSNKINSSTLKYFLEKRVRIIRDSNKFVYIGILRDFDSNAIILDDRVVGITRIPISDLGEVTECRESDRDRDRDRQHETQYAD